MRPILCNLSRERSNPHPTALCTPCSSDKLCSSFLLLLLLCPLHLSYLGSPSQVHKTERPTNAPPARGKTKSHRSESSKTCVCQGFKSNHIPPCLPLHKNKSEARNKARDSSLGTAHSKPRSLARTTHLPAGLANSKSDGRNAKETQGTPKRPKERQRDARNAKVTRETHITQKRRTITSVPQDRGFAFERHIGIQQVSQEHLRVCACGWERERERARESVCVCYVMSGNVGS